MNWLRDLRLLAMHAVVKESGDYNLRYIFRWYSRTFHTPLHVVENLPIDDILQHYYEVEYENLTDPERVTEIEHLLLNPEALMKLRREEDAADADAYEFGKEAEAQKPPEQLAPADLPKNPIEERLQKVRDQFKPPAPAVIAGPETKLPIPKLPPDVHIKFEDVQNPDIDDEPSFGPK